MKNLEELMGRLTYMLIEPVETYTHSIIPLNKLFLTGIVVAEGNSVPNQHFSAMMAILYQFGFQNLAYLRLLLMISTINLNK